MKKIVLIGTGDYYKNLISPSLDLMKKEGMLELFATVSRDLKDLNKPDIFSGVEHIARMGQEKLSSLLPDFEGKNTIVLLGHANRFHVPDAKDLVENNFRVMIEKPYCIDKSQLETLQGLLDSHPNEIGLLEYYLTMKSIPLLILAGKVKQKSFYFRKKGLLKVYPGLRRFTKNIAELSGKIRELIGIPKSILVEVLEGEGETGRLDHRGAHLSDLREGGGMIQDLGIHAVSSLFALEDYIGEIDQSFNKGKVKVARCREYVDMAKNKFKIPDKYIGETYAQMNFFTLKGVPVIVSVGKYVLPNKNQRRIVVVGDRGQLSLDLSSCILSISGIKILEIPKISNSKYYPVLRAVFEAMEGRSPFNFDINDVAIKSQSFILNVLQKAYLKKRKIGLVYKVGSFPQNI